MFTPAVKRLGVDLRFWVASYALYLLAVFFPQSSTFRLLMPMFPLLGRGRPADVAGSTGSASLCSASPASGAGYSSAGGSTDGLDTPVITVFGA